MNNFLQDMQSLTLYKEINKSNLKSKPKKILDEDADDIQLEMVKYKSAVSSKGMSAKVDSISFNDYSSISELSGTNSVNAMTSVKDTLGSSGGLSGTGGGANSKGGSIGSGTSVAGGSSSSLAGYSASAGGAVGGANIPNITQFGLVKMTGTEGKLQNGYTIGKDAVSRASASLDYVTRDENGKSIAEIKDKDGNRLSKLEAKDLIKDIQAERRLVLSPNPRLNLNDEQLDKIVRTTMSSYSESFGKEFEYMYAIHNNTATPHAHILMSSRHPDGDGIKMYKDELFELKMNFEDAIKEEVETSNIRVKDNTTLPMAKQIGNFIGAIPDTNMFNQNKYLAYKISQKFDLEYDQKTIGNDPQKLEEWFTKNQNSYKEYFMSATNKEAFLFQEYSKSATELNSKYDLGLTKEIATDIKDFKTWVDDKKEIFLAERIAQDKHIILQKDDVQDSKKLYKWFMENKSEVKEWNDEYKHFPSKQMGSLASKYGEMVDNAPDNLTTNRKVAREFVKTYTRDPLSYAGDSRKSLYKILGSKQNQFKNELKEERITKNTFESETKRLDSLQNRLIKGQEISEGSLKRYNLDTKLFSTDTKTIELDGIILKNDATTKLSLMIDNHKNNLVKDFKEMKIDEEHFKSYSKKLSTVDYIISKSQNISVSALENAGIDKENDLKDFKIEKVETELKIINFKDTDIEKNYTEIVKEEIDNKQRPLKHQIQKILNINLSQGVKADTLNSSNYTEANKFIDQHTNKEIKEIERVSIEDITQDNYKQFFNDFLEHTNNSSALDENNINEIYTLMSFAIENKDIEMIDKLYEIDKVTVIDSDILELKFQAYSEALEIDKDDIYGKLLEKNFDFSTDDLEKLDNYENLFNTNLEFSMIGKESEFINIDDIKNQLYVDVLVEIVVEKYDEFQWNKFDMDNENNSEENMQGYFQAIQILNTDGINLNDLISKGLEVKALENEIEQNITKGNFNIAYEQMEDTRLDDISKMTFINMCNNLLGDEHIVDEAYERILDHVELEEKTYEIFKEDDFLNDMKKIDLQETMMNEIEDELRQEELEEHELTLGE